MGGHSSAISKPRGLWLRLLCLGGALLAAAALPAQAETYRMDVIVFADNGAGGQAASGAATPDLAGAIGLDNAAGLQAAGITVLPEAQFGLQGEWQRLRNSRRFQPLARISWTQRDPAERGPAIRLRAGSPDAPTLDGRVAMLIVNRYLTLDARLLYLGSGGSEGWPLNERRKMRRDELHHLDAGRLGIIAKVSKLEAASSGGPP